jgi:hypothetical protein
MIYSTSDLIMQMEYARNIHQEWIDEYNNNKSVQDNIGSKEWHERWVDIYNQVIEKLKSCNIN